MKNNPPAAAWNVLAAFFLAWLITSALLMIGGDESPELRFAFAFSGFMCIGAGFRGSLFKGFRLGIASIQRKHLYCMLSLLSGVLMVAALFVPVVIQLRDYGQKSVNHSALRREGASLLEYVEKHNGILPLKMGGSNVYKYITGAQTQEGPIIVGHPFVWCGELSEIRLTDVAQPEKVVLAYTTQPIGSDYGVLFLTGISYSRKKHELDRLLHERPGLLADAIHARDKRVTLVARPEHSQSGNPSKVDKRR